MGITSNTWWEIRCDSCGNTFPDNDAQSEKEAREMVTDYDGEIRDDEVICPTCIEEQEIEEEKDENGVIRLTEGASDAR